MSSPSAACSVPSAERRRRSRGGSASPKPFGACTTPTTRWEDPRATDRELVETDPLVEAAINGDERAFEALVRQHRPDLHRRCARILGADADADDAVQETLVRAWRRLESFEGRSTFATWLHGIATNTCLDTLRRRARAPQLVGDAVLDERAARGDDNPADAAVRRDELRQASLAVRRSAHGPAALGARASEGAPPDRGRDGGAPRRVRRLGEQLAPAGPRGVAADAGDRLPRDRVEE